MGKPKKTTKTTEPKTEPKKECKKELGVKVTAESTKFFRSQEDAREYAIKLLQAGLTFLEMHEWNIGEKDC